MLIDHNDGFIFSGILNTVVSAGQLGICTDSTSSLPTGKNSPIIRFIMESPKDAPSLQAAWPIANAIADPIIPNVFRKQNSWASVILTITTS